MWTSAIFNRIIGKSAALTTPRFACQKASPISRNTRQQNNDRSILIIPLHLMGNHQCALSIWSCHCAVRNQDAKSIILPGPPVRASRAGTKRAHCREMPCRDLQSGGSTFYNSPVPVCLVDGDPWSANVSHS